MNIDALLITFAIESIILLFWWCWELGGTTTLHGVARKYDYSEPPIPPMVKYPVDKQINIYYKSKYLN